MNEKIISVGGVGGSGTRVIANMVGKAGFFMGNDLNDSSDTLLFTLLFKRQNVLVLDEDEFDYSLNLFVKIMSSNEPLCKEELTYLNELASSDRTLHTKEWLQERLKYLNNTSSHYNWAWKEPNTHIVIEKLLNKMSKLKFVYVYRNGLDMAYSDNQNQLKLWGSIFFNDYEMEINPKNSLRYWCIIHKRMLKLKQNYNERVFMLDFDALCLGADEILDDLLQFIGYRGNSKEFKNMIKTQSSINRHKNYSMTEFDKKDLDFVCSKI